MHARTCTHTHPCTPSYTLVHSCTPSYHKRWKKIFLSRIHIYPQGSSSSILASFERVKQTFSPRLLLVTRLRDKGGLGQGGATICGSSSSCSGGGVFWTRPENFYPPDPPRKKIIYIFFKPQHSKFQPQQHQHPTTQKPTPQNKRGQQKPTSFIFTFLKRYPSSQPSKTRLNTIVQKNTTPTAPPTLLILVFTCLT